MHTSYETILLQHFLDMRHYYTLESYKDPIYNKYKKWMVSSYIGHPILYQIKSLLLSHHHSSSALVSEILMSVLQTVQKKQQTIYIWTDSAKKKLHWSIYSAPDSAKKQQQQFTYGQTVQKNCTGAFTVLQTVQKKQQQFTYGQYIFTDCTEDNVQNTYTQ